MIKFTVMKRSKFTESQIINILKMKVLTLNLA